MNYYDLLDKKYSKHILNFTNENEISIPEWFTPEIKGLHSGGPDANDFNYILNYRNNYNVFMCYPSSVTEKILFIENLINIIETYECETEMLICIIDLHDRDINNFLRVFNNYFDKIEIGTHSEPLYLEHIQNILKNNGTYKYVEPITYYNVYVESFKKGFHYINKNIKDRNNKRSILFPIFDISIKNTNCSIKKDTDILLTVINDFIDKYTITKFIILYNNEEIYLNNKNKDFNDIIDKIKKNFITLVSFICFLEISINVLLPSNMFCYFNYFDDDSCDVYFKKEEDKISILESFYDKKYFKYKIKYNKLKKKINFN